MNFTPENEAALIVGVLDLRSDSETSAHITSLEPEAFMVPAHQSIWSAFLELSDAGKVIDAWAMGKLMRKAGCPEVDIQTLDRYFNDSRDGLGSGDLKPRVDVVADAYRRRIISQKMEALSRATEGDSWGSLENALGELSSKVSQAGNPRFSQGTDHATQFDAFLSGEAIYPEDARENLTVFGIPSLDRDLMLNPGRLIVIGGMPSAGKTAFAVQAGIESADLGRRTVFTSLEMGSDEIAARIIAKVAGVDSIKVLRSGGMPRPELRVSFEGIKHNFVGLYGCAGDSWTAIEAAIIREHRRSPLKVAIVDYLQLMESPDIAKKRNDTEAQRIGEITKASKRLAQKLNINVILLSQFNREVQEGQEPTLQNFLGSGQIERDADVAILLWNDTAKGEPSETRTIHCRIAKNRGGDRYGKVIMQFHPAHNTFTEGQGKETIFNESSRPGKRTLYDA